MCQQRLVSWRPEASLLGAAPVGAGTRAPVLPLWSGQPPVSGPRGLPRSLGMFSGGDVQESLKVRLLPLLHRTPKDPSQAQS